MTEQLAQHYADRLLNPPNGERLPFLDRVAGLTRPYVRSVPNGDDGATRRVTLPVPATFTSQDCENDPRFLVPDISTASILFFEDGGTVAQQLALNLQGWQTTLRLLLWLNPARLEGEINDAAVINALSRALELGSRRTFTPFRDLLSSYSVLPGGPNLLAAYSYDEVPLLYPPYKLIGLEIRATYQLTGDCYTAPLPTRKALAPC